MTRSPGGVQGSAVAFANQAQPRSLATAGWNPNGYGHRFPPPHAGHDRQGKSIHRPLPISHTSCRKQPLEDNSFWSPEEASRSRPAGQTADQLVLALSGCPGKLYTERPPEDLLNRLRGSPLPSGRGITPLNGAYRSWTWHNVEPCRSAPAGGSTRFSRLPGPP